MKLLTNALYNSILFKNKTRDDISNCLSSIKFTVKTYSESDTIFCVEQATNYIGIILDGQIEVQKHLPSGNIITLMNKRKGALFGEGSNFSKADTYPCNIIAKKRSDILLINKENMLKLLSNDSVLLENFLNSLSNRILQLNLKTELLAYSSIKQKIAFSLLYLMDEYKIDNIVNLPFSKKTWSEHLNVSRPSLFRELKDLSTSKILFLNGKMVEITNEDELAKLLLI